MEITYSESPKGLKLVGRLSEETIGDDAFLHQVLEQVLKFLQKNGTPLGPSANASAIYSKKKRTHRSIMLLITASRLNDDIELGLLLQRLLSHLPRRILLHKLVRALIEELERAQDLADVALGCLEAALDVFKGGEGEEGNVCGGWATRAEDGDAGDDAEGAFGADEELFEVETCTEGNGDKRAEGM
jgi:hypothetical protein